MAAIIQNHYVLAVHDAKVSAEFYVNVLGFRITMEPPGWVFVSRDNVMIMLGECPDDRTAEELNNHSYFAYLRVDDADAFRAGVHAAGYPLHADIADKPWGMREFGVKTPDGHRIMIGHVIHSPRRSEGSSEQSDVDLRAVSQVVSTGSDGRHRCVPTLPPDLRVRPLEDACSFSAEGQRMGNVLGSLPGRENTTCRFQTRRVARDGRVASAKYGPKSA